MKKQNTGVAFSADKHATLGKQCSFIGKQCSIISGQ